MIKITCLQAENIKRVKAVRLEPTAKGLTVIGGRNGAGKTSFLDAIAFALGGAKFEPSAAKREGSVNPPRISVTLSNGVVVERAGKNSTLRVTDPAGKRAGQSLLDSFISAFALNVPKFLNASAREKAEILLQILGIGDQLRAFDADAERIYNHRHAIGQIAEQKTKYAAELPEYADAPAEPVSASILLQQHQAILLRNAENAKQRGRVVELESQRETVAARTQHYLARIADLKDQLQREQAALEKSTNDMTRIDADLMNARKTTEQLVDESTAEIEQNIQQIEAINSQVAANAEKTRAADDAGQYAAQYTALTEQLEAVRTARMALLNGANLPLPDLGIVDGELVYRNQKWDCMSGSEQLRVAVAIVRRLSPDCGFVLLDKLEQMDLETMREFGAWLESEGLQAIATRVSTGDECSIVIEDGLPVGQTYVDVITAEPTAAEEAAVDLAYEDIKF